MLGELPMDKMYKEAVESAGSGILIINAEGYVTFVNTYAAEILGQPEQSIIGCLASELIVLVDYVTSQKINMPFENLYESGQNFSMDKRAILITPNQKECYIEGALVPLGLVKLDETTRCHWMFSFRNITQFIADHDDLKKFSKAVDQLISTVIITDRSYILEYVNPRFYYMTGVPGDEVLGKHLADIPLLGEFHEGSFERISSTIEKDGRWFGEIKGINKFGREYWLFINATSIYNDLKVATHYVFIIDDVTDRKLYEIELRNERRRLEAIFKNAPVGMIFLNQDSRIVSINEVGAAMFGHTSIDVIGQMMCDILTCENKKLHNPKYCQKCFIGSHVVRALEYGELIQGQEFMQTITLDENPILKWFKCSISPMIVEKNKYALVIVEDITKTKETASELEENEKRLRLITNNMLDLITQVNLNGQIIYVSPSHESILGYKSEYLLQKNLFEFMHPEDLENVLARFKQRIATWSNFTTEFRVRKQDGDYLWMESVGNVVSDDNGTISIVYVSRDISVKKQAEYEIIRSRERAIEASQAKSQFLANMSHEIRTPLNGIIGMTNLTLMSDIHSEHRENLSMVKNSAISLLNIINDVLDFSKIEAGKVAIEKIRFNLYDIVHRVIKPLKVSALQKNIDLKVEIADDVPEYVHGDPVRISQVLNNLISNGIKFTESGYVKLILSSTESVDDHTDIHFTVEDTGIGIEDSDIERIFKSFSQADGTITRKYGGTGLGLSISKMLVELMGGKLEVISKFKKGSKFNFTISFKNATGNLEFLETEDDLVFENMFSKKLKILVCEDEKVNQRFILRLLGKQGHEVDLAENGMEGIHLLQQKTYDVVLMDIQMPVMDGISAVSVIRNELNLSVPVIAVTAYALKGDRERFIKAGMNAYISKPIHIKEFYETLNTVTKNGNKVIEDTLLEKMLSQDCSDISIKMEEYEPLINELRLFLEKQEGEMIERLSHRLKNQFEEDNAVRLKRVAMKLELAARRSAFEEANKYFVQLIDMLNASKGGF